MNKNLKFYFKTANLMSTPRFNLRNASLFLSQLRNKYTRNKCQEQKNYDNTFIDQEEQQLNSGPDRQFINQGSQNKIAGQSDRMIQSATIQQIQKSRAQSPVIQQKIYKPPPENFTENYKQKKQTQFCDLIIIKYLEQTLDIYRNDLSILQHNRQNLEQQIYFIGKKIGKIHEMMAQNVNLKAEIQNLDRQLESAIKQYHESNTILYKKKLEMKTLFQSRKKKITQYLLQNNQIDQIDRTCQDYFRPNLTAAAFNERYCEFIQFKKQQERLIIAKIKQNSTQTEQSRYQSQRFFKKLLQGKEHIYLSEDQPKKNTSQIKNIAPQIIKEKQKKVILYDDYQDNQEFEGKPKGKDKPRKLSQSQKASLLGDLKNFSKSFKIPK